MTSYNVVASGSSGNAVVYHNEILVDLGIAYARIERYLPTIKYLLLTHRHTDHLNIKSILTLAADYPEIMILGNSETITILSDYGVENTHVLQSGRWYDLGHYKISPVDLIHDETNFGYRIFKKIYKTVSEDFRLEWDYHKTLHATDCVNLFDIEAYDYDVYAIEKNYCEDLIQKGIENKLANGEYIREYRTMENHQSIQEANKWLKINNVNGEVVPLHISDTYGRPYE